MCQRRWIPSTVTDDPLFVCRGFRCVHLGVYPFRPFQVKASPCPVWTRTIPLRSRQTLLKLNRNENIAIFRGNVDALQGEMRLRADELTVHYRSAKEQWTRVSTRSGVLTLPARYSSPRAVKRRKERVGVYDVENNRHYAHQKCRSHAG